MKDGQATRRRLLDAAGVEFATHGIAGARVDRIAASARANKSQLYAWYGSKNALFDAVFAEHLQAIVDLVPLDGKDLSEYAIRIYNACVERPAVVRLAMWARLERIPPDKPASESEETLRRRASIAAAQHSGHIDASLDPKDVQSMLWALALTWSPASLHSTAFIHDPERDHERRRRALAATVRRAFAPEPAA